MSPDLLCISEEVTEALQCHTPVLVLETPAIRLWSSACDVLAITRMVAKLARDNQTVPAHIALHQGKIHIGLDDALLEQLCSDSTIPRASRRDIPYYLSNRQTVNTHISATLFCAHLTGLPIFVSAGLCDIPNPFHNRIHSIDLLDLSSIPVAMVCSGAQSVIDLPKTLEILEAQGASLIGYQTNDFPAFLNHSSGIVMPYRLDSAAEIARLMLYQKKLQIHNPLIIANPIPKAAEVADAEILPFIQQAQRELAQIRHKAITPKLLNRISELTADQNVHSYTQLLQHNVCLGADIANHYQKLVAENFLGFVA